MEHAPRIIVTLTSHPARIGTVHTAVRSLLRQTLRPDAIVLYLGYDKFPNREAALPKELTALCGEGLLIHWIKDQGCFTTLLPALEEYPDDIIVNVDDDIDYPAQLVERLVRAYRAQPDVIHCHIAHRLAYRRDGRLLPYTMWGKWRATTTPSFHNFIISTMGVIYPPHCFHKDIANAAVYEKITPTNDDIWFWAMAVLNGVKIRALPDGFLPGNNVIDNTQACGLFQRNKVGGINDIYLARIFSHYPELAERLRTEPPTYGVKETRSLLFGLIPLWRTRCFPTGTRFVWLFGILPFLKIRARDDAVRFCLFFVLPLWVMRCSKV